MPVRIGRSADAVRGAIWGRFGGPGGDLLFHALRRSTIGAEGFHGRVRDGIGCLAPRYGHQAGQNAPARKRAAGLGAPAGLRAAGANGAPAPGPHAAPATGRPKRVACSVSCRERGLPSLAFGATGVAPVASVELAFHRDAACRWMWTLASAIERLVPVSCAGCPASTSGLSTWWSTTALGETWF